MHFFFQTGPLITSNLKTNHQEKNNNNSAYAKHEM